LFYLLSQTVCHTQCLKFVIRKQKEKKTKQLPILFQSCPLHACPLGNLW